MQSGGNQSTTKERRRTTTDSLSMNPIDEYNDVTGVILAGGKSKRMGSDKALLEVDGVTMFDRVLDSFQGIFSDILIAGNRPDLVRPGVPCYPDPYPGSSLGGIYTGLDASKKKYVFVAACDIPFPDPDLIRMILSHRKGNDVVIFNTPGGLEPCFALYSRACRRHIKRMLEREQYHIGGLYPDVNVYYFNAEDLGPRWEKSLKNINTPEEYHSVKEKPIMNVPIVSLVAKSNTGKTTLIVKLISEFKRRGYKVGAIKHDAHKFDIDKEGKDSWKLTHAGADTMAIISSEKMAVVKMNRDRKEIDVKKILNQYFSDMDIVLTEGFKKSQLPKIEVHRKARSDTLICRGEINDDTLIAVASDEDLDVDVPLYDINDHPAICDFIEKRFLEEGSN